MPNETAFFSKERVAHPLLRRAMLYLEDEEWRNADEACERVLDEEPENPYAYVLKLMVELRVRGEKELRDYPNPIDNDRMFQKALKFADPELREQLTAINGAIVDRLEQQRQEQEQRRLEQERIDRQNNYYKAMALIKPDASTDSLEKAVALLKESCGYQDAAEQIALCEQRLRQRRAEAQAYEEAQRKKKLIFGSVIAAVAIVLTIFVCRGISSKNEKRAEAITQNLQGKTFSGESHDIDVPQGSFVASRYEEIKETFHFTFVDTVEVTKKVSVDYDGTIITINGVKQYDSVNTTEDVYTFEDVTVSFTGEATIRINGKTYDVLLDSNDEPIGLKRGSTEFR